MKGPNFSILARKRELFGPQNGTKNSANGVMPFRTAVLDQFDGIRPVLAILPFRFPCC
jgi:hypothetical protein